MDESTQGPEQPTGDLSLDELRDAWPVLSGDERLEGFRLLPRSGAEEFFLEAEVHQQVDLLMALKPAERKFWFRSLAPDDMADLIQLVPSEQRPALLALLDEPTLKEVTALLAYAEDDAGGLMNPRYAVARADMSVDEAIGYVRKQARERLQFTYYVYVMDAEQKLLGVVSFRQLLLAQPDRRMRDLMKTDLITVPVEMDQEEVSRLVRKHALLAVPVVDKDHHMKGVVTVDDIVDVVAEEATEDVHKFGGMEALDAPYFRTTFREMIQKRGGWLSILFIGETLTASAMGYFEHELEKAVVLALFIPMIISSGGNSGSQASTLVIRAMALQEVRMSDWMRVMRRELSAGLVLGIGLASVGLLRILVWQLMFDAYPPTTYLRVALAVAFSLVGVVTFGTLAGSMLPFLLRRLNFDPASASAPFVATLVDVTGLVIYFTMSGLFLGMFF